MRLVCVMTLLASCTGADTPDPSPLLDVAESERLSIPGLFKEVYVIRTEGNVPHIYAENELDLARVHGFLMGRDRFFELDMARRVSLGRISELLGDGAFDLDLESRQIGMTAIADLVLDNMTSEQAAMADAFAGGINAYIDRVEDNLLPGPSEYEIAFGILGAPSAAALMEDFDRRSIAGIFATILYELGFETGDAGRGMNYGRLATLYDGEALEEQRTAGVYADVWDAVAAPFPYSSAPGWGTTDGGGNARSGRFPSAPHVPAVVRDRVLERIERIEARNGHDHASGWGSNAWAVGGYATPDGRSLLAGDWHLGLTVPSFLTQVHLDTAHLGRGRWSVAGFTIPGTGIIASGTNGHVAWSQTQLIGDITDWYTEELELDADGAPSATLFEDAWQPLTRHDETIVVADVPLLDSVGRTETWSHWTTFDGRWLYDIEGRDASADEPLAPGETLVNLQGDYVVPGDVDGDGVVTAISFDYAGFDAVSTLLAVEEFGRARSIDEYRESMRKLVAYSLNTVVADATGSILYSGYQAVPCRSWLPRDVDGRWIDGADPSLLLDGTTYGGFSIPVDSTGAVDEASGATDPSTCVVPFDAYPQSIDPAEGYVVSANNDPGGITTDDSLYDDPWYIGGPWMEGHRADTIAGALADHIAAGTADADAMKEVQGNHDSRVGEYMAPVLLDAIDVGRDAAASSPDPGTAELRTARLFEKNEDRFEEVQTRVAAWAQAGFQAKSGVVTFYDPGSAEDVDDAVATMLFNAWMGNFVQLSIGDEGWPGVHRPTGDTGRTRILKKMVEGRGAGNPLGLASWNPATEESAFFDLRGTADIETSEEIALMALEAAVDYLESEAGFGTADMGTWLWGMKHTGRIESILSDFIGDSDEFSFLTDQFSIDTGVIELDTNIGVGDPRRELEGFPSHGDNLAVEGMNSGFSTTDWTYGSGAVMRMVVALGPDGPQAWAILPSGQSGLNDSPYFADQAVLWLGNDYLPLHISLDDVVANALSRETYTPAGVPRLDFYAGDEE